MMQSKTKVSVQGIIAGLFDISLIFYFIVYYTFHGDYGTGTIRLIATVFLLVAGLFLCIYRVPKIDSFVVTYVLFAFYAIFSLLWAKNSDGLFSQSVIFFRIIFILLFLKARIRHVQDIHKVMIAYIIATAFRMVYVARLMISLYGSKGFLVVRFGDNFGFNSNENALQCLLCLVFLMYFFMEHKKRLLSTVGIAFFSFFLIISGSRKGVLGLLLCLSLIYIMKSSGAKKVQRILLGAITIILGIELCLNIPFLYDIVGHRIESILSSDTMDSGSKARIELIKEAFNVWLRFPLFGCGLDNFAEYQTVKVGVHYYSHNNYLEILANLGVIGFAIYYSIIAKNMMKTISKKSNIQVILKALCITMLFFDIGTVSYSTFYIIALYYLMYLSCDKALNYNTIEK